MSALPFSTMFQGSRTAGSPAPNSPASFRRSELLPAGTARPRAQTTVAQWQGRSGERGGLHRTGGDVHAARRCFQFRSASGGWARGLGPSHPRMPRRGLPRWCGVENRPPGPGTQAPAVVPDGSACHPGMKPRNHSCPARPPRALQPQRGKAERRGARARSQRKPTPSDQE